MFNSFGKFSISYETRLKEEYNSQSFLEQILKSESLKNKYIDVYHISQAFLTIKEWFEDNSINKANFLFSLFNVDYRDEKDIANNVRLIWYEVKNQSEVEAGNIFARINMDKNPLTNAELIKVLLFNNENQTDKENEKNQSKLSNEWDYIENTLEDKKFWVFQNKFNNSKSTKIELIFDLIANKYQDKAAIEINKSMNGYYTFYVFNELINNDIRTKDELWEEIQTYFKAFEELFNDTECFHLIGFLIHTGKNIEQIKSIFINISKSDSKKELLKLKKKDIKNYLSKKEILKSLE